MKVKTRYAPSPTGKPHVGNIRTAIYDFLYARVTGGQFILRIEDTDRERFVPEAIGYIEESLEWLGLSPDNEEKIHQSERLGIYKKYAEKLLAEGKAYKCFCTRERLGHLREEQVKAKKPPGYDSCCRKLTKEDIEKLEKEGHTSVLRFKIPDTPKEVTWNDVIRDKVSIRTDIQDDFVIVKSDGYPTYHLASVIDDHEMDITTVIRAEEWIPSTPKHILLYQALGWEPPEFAHMPHIIGSDRSKLSKRHGDTAIMEYKDQGYLADTMINFLALLGWNDGTTQEIFTREELEKKFDLKRVGKSPAVFDLSRLNWINGEKIRAMKVADLMKEIRSFNPSFLKEKNSALAEKALTVSQTRMVTLKDFTEDSTYFFETPQYDAKILVFGKSTHEATLKGMTSVLKVLESKKSIETAKDADDILKSAVEAENLSNGDVFWPVRVSLSGQEKSPSPGELMWALGKEETVERIRTAIKLLS